MIADKILPAFYMIELSGSAAASLFPIDCGIKRITFGSEDFISDLHAHNASEQLLRLITKECVKSVDEQQFNPEFFPSLNNITENDILRRAEQEQETIEQLVPKDSNLVPIVITKYFDELGDFVESRHTISGDGFLVISKIAINPQQYVLQKKAIKETEQNPTSHVNPNTSEFH